MPERLYFAHAVNSYDTPVEKAALKLLARAFPLDEIENPNQPKHQAGYTAYRDRTAKSRDDHKGMSYFYDEVLPGCTGAVAMPFLDGRFGLGVASEIKQTIECGKPTWGMFPTEKDVKPGRLESWVQNPVNGLFQLRNFTDAERDEILASTKDGSALVVGHQETRLRTYLVYNVTMRPYEAAHLVSMPIPEGFYPPEKK
jgi:hypothetical protein